MSFVVFVLFVAVVPPLLMRRLCIFCPGGGLASVGFFPPFVVVLVFASILCSKSSRSHASLNTYFRNGSSAHKACCIVVFAKISLIKRVVVVIRGGPQTKESQQKRDAKNIVVGNVVVVVVATHFIRLCWVQKHLESISIGRKKKTQIHYT